MPTYEYQCPKCGVFEFVQKMSDKSLATCPTCGSPVTRLLSAAPFHLKGSGWYKTDYGSKSDTGSKSNGGDTKSSAKSDVTPTVEKKSTSETTSTPSSDTTTSPSASSTKEK